MQRILIPCTVSYIYGIVAAELFRYFPITVTILSVFSLLMLIYMVKVRQQNENQRYLLLSIVIISAITGFSYMLYKSGIAKNDISRYATGEKLTVIGMVGEPAKYSSSKVTAIINASKIRRGEEEFNVLGRTKVSIYDPHAVLNYGDIIMVTGKLKLIRGFNNPGLFNYAKYIARQGIRTSVSISRMEFISKTGTGGNPLLRRIYKWRDKIRVCIAAGLPEPSAGILKAMIIGDTGTITNEVRDKFNAAGVTHILSISGSHLGFVAFITFFIIRHMLIHLLPYQTLLRMSLYIIPSKVAALCTFFTVIFYTLLSGGEVATVRSLIMIIVYMMAILTEREDDAVNTLVLAALLVLLWNPQALFDISFQLSYMAVFSMIITVKRFHKIESKVENTVWWKRYNKKFLLFTLLTLGATASTSPITAHYYNQITWTGLISNMIVVPLAGFMILPLGLFTSFLTLILNTDVIPLAWLNNILLNLFYWFVEFFAQFPYSIIYTPSPGMVFIISLYLLMLSLLFYKTKYAQFLLPISILFILFSIGLNRYKEDNRNSIRATFLDVGQGDSALIEFPDKKVMLIDGGGTFSETFDIGRSVVAPYLWNSGIRKIDYIVSSHPQLDHIEGLYYIVDKFSIGEVWANGTANKASKEFNSILERKGIRGVIIDRNSEDLVIGGCKTNFLNPPKDKETSNINNLSIVMRLLCKDISLLFTGDIEAAAMKNIAANGGSLESTVIKVPHHGSKGSVEDTFITSVKPQIAVISAGYQNSYHHPSTEAISAYENRGAVVYRTDLNGAVIIQNNDGRIKAITYEDTALREVDFKNPASIFHTELSNIKKI